MYVTRNRIYWHVTLLTWNAMFAGSAISRGAWVTATLDSLFVVFGGFFIRVYVRELSPVVQPIQHAVCSVCKERHKVGVR